VTGKTLYTYFTQDYGLDLNILTSPNIQKHAKHWIMASKMPFNTRSSEMATIG